MQWAQIAAGMGPIAQATVKMDAIADYVADKLGIPTDLRTSDSERMEMEQQVQQMLQAQQQVPGDMAQEPLPPQ